MRQIHQKIIEKHMEKYRQMVCIVGPRGIGKTTLCKHLAKKRTNTLFLDWEIDHDREIILSGVQAIDNVARTAFSKGATIILDNISGHPDMKNFLTCCSDHLSNQYTFIATGNHAIERYHADQDSMMGRYFSYTIHPTSVAELCHRDDVITDYTLPKKIATSDWNNLLEFGGFPEPFYKATKHFHSRWSKQIQNTIINIDIRETTRINNLKQLELLAQLLKKNIGSPVNASQLSRTIQTSVPTVTSWLTTLSAHYCCFSLTPWPNNIKRSLSATPKYYLYDWSQTNDYHQKIENLVASHLKKAVDFWNNLGIGDYSLYYLRDKEQHEVDFLVIKNGNPWLMIDTTGVSNRQFNPALLYFQQQLKVPHVFQITTDMDYIDKDCFSAKAPTIVPITTFLSQLV